MRKIFITAFILVLIDQILKIWVKTHMPLNEIINIFDWFKIRFVENEGMAFGKIIPGIYGKLILTLFRIIVVGWGVFYVNKLIKEKQFPTGPLICLGLIIGGALGNIIDSAFYGVIFNASYDGGPVAQFLPEGGGYAPFLYGKVVDMFSVTFFPPVFNIADAGISVGIFIILLFYRKVFN